MKNEIKAITNDSKKKKQSWSQTSKVNGITKEINVEELDNGGYLITIYKSGEDNKGRYLSSTKKLYSKINPLDADGQVDPLDQVLALIKPNN